MKHCNNCSACCEVIAIDNLTHEEISEKIKWGAVDAIYGEMLLPLSRDQAYQKNPLIVSSREAALKGTGRVTSYFTCSKLKDNRCSIYDRRPVMCSGYPFYGKVEVNEQSHAELSKQQLSRKETPYSPTCTYVPNLIQIREIV